MHYFDTDVLIHSFVNQNSIQNSKANELIEEATRNKNFLISWLSIQEVGFVLGKLNQPVSAVTLNLNSLIASSPVKYGSLEFSRAIELAKEIGFKDFNDCLHTAIAEQHCTNLFTCNYKDFNRIQPHKLLNIHFL